MAGEGTSLVPLGAYGEPISIPETVRQDWSLAAAIEGTRPGNLFPSRVGWFAARSRSRRTADVLSGQSSVGLRPIPVEIVRAPKGDRATRPAADMSVEEQILLSALTELVRQNIPPDFVAFTDEDRYEEFERFPLEAAEVAYVVEADVASFYQNISHERLASELIGLTGRADATDALVRLLEAWMGDTRGLPQGPAASNLLADIYLSPAARTLDRAGFRFRRYSDDFRVIAATWEEAKSAQLALEAALYELGLAVAPGKLRALKLETYRARVARVNDQRLQRAVFRDAVEELEAGEYAPQPDRLEGIGPVEVARAEEVLREVVALQNPDVLATRLLRRTLFTLAAGGSPSALDSFPILLARYAHLAPVLSLYARELMATDFERATVARVVRVLQSTSYKFPWQIGWLLSALCHARERSQAAAAVVGGALHSDHLPWFARGQAALALAIHGRLPRPTEFVDVYELSSRAARADFVAAVALAPGSSWRSSFLKSVATAESPVLSAIGELPTDSYRDWL